MPTTHASAITPEVIKDHGITPEEYERIKEHPFNKTFAFNVREIRVGRGARFRFDARMEVLPGGK